MSTTTNLYSTGLDPRRREIRLLVLRAGDFSADLQCSLSVVSLGQEKAPCYDALSYVWGSVNNPRSIQVDGVRLDVTQNLEVALRYLRRPLDDRYVWIDAVCINQASISERNSQVGMMGDVYRSARHVLVWIGEADEVSDFAFDSMPRVNASSLESLDAGRVWSFYANAVKRPYFGRVWIIQELVLASQDPVILCGHKRASWSVFMSAYKTLALEFFTKIDMFRQEGEGRLPEITAKLKYDLFDELRDTVHKEDGADLRQLLIMSRTSESSQPRDRIYGIHQMLDQEDRNSIEIDYNKPVAVVFAEAMSLIFKHGDGPHFISGEWCPSKPNHSVPDLPSWVPDFTSQMADKAFPNVPNFSFRPPFPRTVSGAGEGADNGKVLEDLKSLQVEALHLDVIEDVLYLGETLEECISQLGEIERRAEAARSRPILDMKLRPYFEKFRSSEPLWRTLVCDKKYNSGYDVAPGSYEAMHQQLRSRASVQDATDQDVPTTEYRKTLESLLPRRVFFTTKNGLVGLGVPALKEHDEISIWFGAPVPFVVRPCGLDDNTKCRLIGAAYVAGIMEGQMVDELYCEELLDSKTLIVI